MAAVAAGAAIVGAATAIYGQISSAQTQAELEREKQGLAEAQAREVIAREQINDQQLQESAYRSKLAFGSQFAASGHEGAGVGSQLEIQRQADLQQMLNDREAAFQAYMLEKGAQFQGQLASNTSAAGYFNAAGTLLGATGKLAGSAANRPNPNANAGFGPVGPAQMLPASQTVGDSMYA